MTLDLSAETGTSHAPDAPHSALLNGGKRGATRARITDLACRLFFDVGFDAATMEEIAKAADIRRSTLYLHFKDKDEILGAIADAYTVKLGTVVSALPGPEPTRDDLRIWVEAMAEFVSREPAATELLVTLSHLPKAPQPAILFGHALKEMMAARVAMFRRAMMPGEAMTYAWGVAAMDGLGWALCHHARSGGNEISKARLAVATEQLHRFVQGDF